MTPRVTLMMGAMCACAAAQKPVQRVPADARQIVAAPDRAERDRSMDPQRKPVQMLEFFGTAPGMRVADLGAGGGYSTELWARAVGPSGSVYAQDTPDWGVEGLTKVWQARLARPALQNTKHEIRYWDDPFPDGVKDLDAVYMVAAYHDVLNEKRDVAAMNRAVFAALKPGGIFGIIDNSAKAGSGASDVGTLHRVDEQLVRDQVAAAGFKLAGEAGFLRNPADPRDWNADSGVNKTHDQDRFALKFIKP